MSQVPNGRSVFGERLRAELERQDLSIRKLARRIDPKNPAVARRNLHRWISGTKPQPASRALVAHALGLDTSHFDEDDEEEDSEMADLVRALLHRIDRRVDEEFDRRLGVES